MNQEYVLLTSARNEEANIAKTLDAVLGQTHLPQGWGVVDDGSSDRTKEIVACRAAGNDRLVLMSLSQGGQRNFASKARALNRAYEQIRHLPHDFVGCLDADISFGADYFERLLGEFARRPTLGLAGGVIVEWFGDCRREQRISRDSVAGAVQFFRRQCFEEIGGYVPLEWGGIDTVAEIMVRMHGWEVQTIPELRVEHFRRVGSGAGNLLRARYRQGRADYAIGYDPLFYAAVCLYRLADRPFVAGSVLRVLGYCCALAGRVHSPLPVTVRRYLRKEQRRKLLNMLGRRRETRALPRPRRTAGP